MSIIAVIAYRDILGIPFGALLEFNVGNFSSNDSRSSTLRARARQ